MEGNNEEGGSLQQQKNQGEIGPFQGLRVYGQCEFGGIFQSKHSWHSWFF